MAHTRRRVTDPAGGCFRTMNGEEHTVGKWDLIIAHPPCTYLSNAGACRLYPKKHEYNNERFIKGLEAKRFLITFLKTECDRIAVENPVPASIFNLPIPSQIIQPYEFGHPYTKKTLLWLKGLKPLIPTNIVNPISPYCPSGTGRKNRENYGAAKRGEDAKNRSKTFPGIAKAMAEQWGGMLLRGETYTTPEQMTLFQEG